MRRRIVAMDARAAKWWRNFLSSETDAPEVVTLAELSDAEKKAWMELAERPMPLGVMRSSSAQYRTALQRRRGIRHVIERLPEVSKAGTAMLGEFSSARLKRVEKLLRGVSNVPRHKQISEAIRMMQQSRIRPVPDRKTVAKWLVGLGLRS